MEAHEIKQQLLLLIPRLAHHKVLVIGDLFLDEYILGRASRLSREAPIPVLEFVRRFHVPGGAANPAHNICALGSQATVVGLIGQDDAGAQLLSELRRVGIDPAGVVLDDTRPTTTKTRIVAEGTLRFPQQLARIDHLDRHPMNGEIEARVISQVRKLVQQADAVLISDYQTGVNSQAVVEATLTSAYAQGKLCVVDAQGAFQKYIGVDLIKGNRQEIETSLAQRLREEGDYHLAGERLLHRLHARAAIITRGADGLSLIAREEGYFHFAAANRTEVFDVTGAGDTIVGVATLALVAGANISTAAQLANYAAGWVVRKLGNAVAAPDELAWAVENW
jgi:rfaE bifunctional protein kinase chain/domain